MVKSYSKYTYEDLKKLGVTVQEKILFTEGLIAPVVPSDFLEQTLLRSTRRRKLKTEKAKSEFLIAPVLGEIEERNPDIAFYSGYNFDVDKSQGLAGFCDYLFSFEALSPIIEAPVFCVVEAKNENLETGIPQCIAEMYAAQTFNAARGRTVSPIFGATTFGWQWKFHKLENKTAISDINIYNLNQLPQLLGVLQHIVDSVRLQVPPISPI
jgi:hypothetical protein